MTSPLTNIHAPIAPQVKAFIDTKREILTMELLALCLRRYSRYILAAYRLATKDQQAEGIPNSRGGSFLYHFVDDTYIKITFTGTPDVIWEVGSIKKGVELKGEKL